MKNQRSTLKNLVAENIDECFAKLKDIAVKNQQLYSEWILLKGRYNDNRKYFNRNLEDKSKLDIENNKIRGGLLSLIDSIPIALFDSFEKKNHGSQKKFDIGLDLGNQITFYTVDECPQRLTFPKLIKGAKKVYLLARTAVNLFGPYERKFTELLNSECEIKFLTVDHNSDAAKYIYGSPEIYYENIRKIKHSLKRILNNENGLIEIRKIKFAPTFSVLYIENDMSEEFVVIQMYFLHSRVSKDRPLFLLNSTDKWFSAFKTEFDLLWDGAEKWELKEE